MGLSTQPVPGKYDVAGDLSAALTSPGLSALGIYAGLSGYGSLRVTHEPSILLSDSFDVAFDANTWVTGGTVPPSGTVGSAAIEPGTTASASSSLVSVPTFAPPGGTFLGIGMLNRFENVGAATGLPGYLNSHRFWGFGAVPATWTPVYTAASTTANPLLNGYGFEVDVDGYLYAVVYANGTRTRADAIGQATGEKRLNLGRALFNGEMHQYTIVVRPDAIFWYIDGQDLPAALLNYRTAGFPIPAVQVLPLRLHTINGTTGPTGTIVHRPAALAVADTGSANMTIGDGTYGWRKVQVGKNGGLSVKGVAIAQVSGSIAAGATGTIGPVDISEAGNITFVVKNQAAANPYQGTPVLVFEQSDDNVSWGPLLVVRSDTSAPASTHILAANTANAELMFDAPAEAINWVRVRVTTGPTTAGMTILVSSGGMPFSPVVTTIEKTNIRVPISLNAVGSAAGATATETAQAVAGVRGTAAIASANSIPLTPGKTTRITGLRFRSIGNATATTQSTIHKLRLGIGAAVTTTTTPVLFQARTTTPATALAGDFFDLPLGDGFDIVVPPGGNYQLGVTAAATYVTNAPTWDVQITGYEFVS